jgi:hypothetical protein
MLYQYRPCRLDYPTVSATRILSSIVERAEI